MNYEVDLDGIIQSKMKGKKLPGFVMKALRRFLHIDYINGYLREGREGIDFCCGTTEYMGVTIEVEGLENVPKGGRYTFASNHPLGGIDGVALGGIIGRNFGDVRVMVNDFLMAIPGLRPICIPVNKTGGQGRDLPRLISEGFDSENQMMVFPAGACSRLIDGKVQDVPWSKTFIMQSVRTGRDIVPVHFIGENSRRFYRIARLCKVLRLKVNIAMGFLPDELYRNRGKKFKVIFGKPIPYSTFDSSKKPIEWAAFVREEVYKL